MLRYVYDADGRQTERQEPAGTTVTARDARGNVIATTDPAGRVTRYEYDSKDREIARIDATGAVWRTGYDVAGRVVARTDPLGAVTKYEYDPAGRLTAVIDPLGNKTRYRYDGTGRLLETEDPEGGVARNAYDAAGRVTSQTTPAGLVTRFSYDADGRVIAVTDPRGGVTRTEYSARGEQTAIITPTGAVRRLHYDRAGQLISAVDPNGAETRYTYDAAGNQASLVDAKGATTTFTHDAAGRPTSSTDPLGRKTTREYDASGNLVAVTEPSGQVLRLRYNAVGELLKLSAADGSTTGYTYDGVGRRTSMTDATGVTKYEHDLAGRLLTVTGPDNAKFTSSYDAAGRRVELKYPDGLKISYRYDRNSRLVGLKDPKAGDATFTVDRDGRLTAEKLPHKWSRAYAYDGGMLSEFSEWQRGERSQKTMLARNADGRIVSETNFGHAEADATGGKTREFRYDPAGQLLSATGKHTEPLLAAYDAVGNRTAITRGKQETRLTYDAADQLVATDTGKRHVDHRYDTSGRLTGKSGKDEQLSISRNGFGLPVSVTTKQHGDSRTRNATFDGDGLLVALSSGDRKDDTVRYRWSYGLPIPQILTQRASGEHRDTDFVYGHARMFADVGNHTATFSRDVHGSAIQTEDTTGWTQASDYDEFGQPLKQLEDTTELDQPTFGYRGELALDSTVYLRARVYDTKTGRFTMRDPVATKTGQANPVSPYAYAANDPLNATDPLGEWPLTNIFSQILSGLVSLFQKPPCPPPNNSITRHRKCFQGTEMATRGYIQEDCLNAEHGCLNHYWQIGQRERAAQAFTINELNQRRQSWWDDLWDSKGWGTTISEKVDWEVGPPYYTADAFRIDIVTNETFLYEVKEYRGGGEEAEVEGQIQHYLAEMGTYYDIRMERGFELSRWAETFQVNDGTWSFLTGGKTILVWGWSNLPGHIYFAEKDKAPARVRNRVWWDRILPPIAPPIGIPIPDRVPA